MRREHGYITHTHRYAHILHIEFFQEITWDIIRYRYIIQADKRFVYIIISYIL